MLKVKGDQYSERRPEFKSVDQRLSASSLYVERHRLRHTPFATGLFLYPCADCRLRPRKDASKERSKQAEGTKERVRFFRARTEVKAWCFEFYGVHQSLCCEMACYGRFGKGEVLQIARRGQNPLPERNGELQPSR